MEKPHILNAVLVPTDDTGQLGSVETPILLRWVRPLSLGLWVFIFTTQVFSLVSEGTTNWILLVLVSALFVCVQAQYWYEESQRGLGLRRTIERLRGEVFEDDTTGLPNSRHFLAELRRQMMRSVRNGRGFSLILVDVVGFDPDPPQDLMADLGRSLRRVLGESAFAARLEGATFAGIVADTDGDAWARLDDVLVTLPQSLPRHASSTRIVASLTSYAGETEVRDYLRRAYRDLVDARSKSLNPRRQAFTFSNRLAS